MLEYDVIMIGCGPAGLSAALYTSRANLKTLVIGKDRGALEWADKIDNYFGMAGTLSGCELIENSKTQVQKLGADLLEDEIFHLSFDGSFLLEGKRNQYRGKAVLLATGAVRKGLRLKGLEELKGRGVSYCAVCDAFFYRGRQVAVLGNEAYALHELEQLLPIVGSVTLLTNGKSAPSEVPEGVLVIEQALASVDGEEYVEGVTFQDGSKLAIDGLFVALGSAGADALAQKIGAVTENGRIVVGEEMETNVPGLFAAGDCIGGILQISTAVGEGAKAAMSMIRYVREQKK